MLPGKTGQRYRYSVVMCDDYTSLAGQPVLKIVSSTYLLRQYRLTASQQRLLSDDLSQLSHIYLRYVTVSYRQLLPRLPVSRAITSRHGSGTKGTFRNFTTMCSEKTRRRHEEQASLSLQHQHHRQQNEMSLKSKRKGRRRMHAGYDAIA